MKIQNPFFLFVCLSIALYCTNKGKKADISSENNGPKDFRLVLSRGAFHYDRFELTANKIEFIPDSTAQHDMAQYSTFSETELDSLLTMAFLKEVEERGFWKLKNTYGSSSSCTSELRVTLEKEKRTKTVICDDFERDCPELIKYIDKKIVELEGNDLKRIYLPG